MNHNNSYNGMIRPAKGSVLLGKVEVLNPYKSIASQSLWDLAPQVAFEKRQKRLFRRFLRGDKSVKCNGVARDL